MSVFQDLILEKDRNKWSERLSWLKKYFPIIFPQYTNPLGGFGSFPKKFIQRRHEEATLKIAENFELACIPNFPPAMYKSTINYCAPTILGV